MNLPSVRLSIFVKNDLGLILSTETMIAVKWHKKSVNGFWLYVQLKW